MKRYHELAVFKRGKANIDPAQRNEFDVNEVLGDRVEDRSWEVLVERYPQWAPTLRRRHQAAWAVGQPSEHHGRTPRSYL